MSQNSIIENQNKPEYIKLLRASTAAYTKAKSGEVKITYFLLFLSIAYPLCYLFTKDESVKLILFACSFLLTVIVQIFSDNFKGNTSKGAIFKEEFDTSLFNLRWKSTLKRPDHSEISQYSIQYKGNEIKNWYSTNLSETIPHNIIIAVLQHSNTSWDVALRKTYRKYLINFIVFYSIALFAIFVIKKTDGLTIFLLLFSLLSLYTHFISLIRGNSWAIEKRESISKHLDEIIQKKHSVTLQELRDIQDEIYITRQEPTKVPNFFFNWYKKEMNATAEDYIAMVNEIYKNRKS